MVDGETKRLEAKALRGVSYDRRTDRFTAEIYVGGCRTWLGSFATAAEASAAYLDAVARRPAISRKSTSFGKVYVAFREEHGGLDEDPPVGASLVYDGQTYVVRDYAFRSTARGAFRYLVWESTCRSCGEAYTTMTAFSPDFAKGITRNCAEHVTKGRGLRWARKAEAACEADATPEASKTLTLEEQSLPHLEALEAVRGRWPLDEVARYVCGELLGRKSESSVPGFKARLRRWAAGEFETPCVFALEGDTVVFQ